MGHESTESIVEGIDVGGTPCGSIVCDRVDGKQTLRSLVGPDRTLGLGAWPLRCGLGVNGATDVGLWRRCHIDDRGHSRSPRGSRNRGGIAGRFGGNPIAAGVLGVGQARGGPSTAPHMDGGPRAPPER